MVESSQQKLGRGDWRTIGIVYCLLYNLLDVVHRIRYTRVLPALLMLEFKLDRGFDWWMEIGVKWCSTGLVTVLRVLKECQLLLDKLRPN